MKYGEKEFSLKALEDMAKEIDQDALAENPEQLEQDNASRNHSSYNCFYKYHRAVALS